MHFTFLSSGRKPLSYGLGSFNIKHFSLNITIKRKHEINKVASFSIKLHLKFGNPSQSSLENFLPD